MLFTVATPSSPVEPILNPDGEVIGTLPDLPPNQLFEFYRYMVFGRVFSDHMVALQRQGRMGTFSPVNGQEAVCVGMAVPLHQKDWLVGTYRDYLAYHVKGVPLLAQLSRWGGGVVDSFPRELGCLPLQVVLGTQVLHAVGIAQAMKYSNDPQVVVTACGDGATSEGDFSEALNFAGVFKAPIVFVVQNNGWAISTPRQRQTAAKHIADRAFGFGIPGYVVDGNDVLAVYQLISECVDRARASDGPSLVEAVTYRLGAHTTADDPTKYRADGELQDWLKRDPLIRYRKFLMNQDMLTDTEDQRLYEEVTAEIRSTIETFESLPDLSPDQLFSLVFSEPPPQLHQQQAQLLDNHQVEESS